MVKVIPVPKLVVGTRDEHGSRLKTILAGSGLDRTAIFLKIRGQDWVGLRKFLMLLCDYSEHIYTFSCDLILRIC